jgi:hypothetical protein
MIEPLEEIQSSINRVVRSRYNAPVGCHFEPGEKSFRDQKRRDRQLNHRERLHPGRVTMNIWRHDSGERVRGSSTF